MLLLGLMTLIFALVLLVYAIGLIGVRDAAVTRRLQAAEVPASSRTGASSQANSLDKLAQLAPAKLSGRWDRSLQIAGRPYGLTVGHVVAAKLTLPALVGFFTWSSLVAPAPSFLTVLIFLVGTGMAFVLPDAFIYGRAKDRQDAIAMALPDTLDQITIAIESGLGFDAALARAGEAGRGPLADELTRTVQDVRLGMSRRDAYAALADRTQVDDVGRFARSVIQATEYGVPVSTIVRSLAGEMRVTRRQRAEGRAQQVPTKMLFPMMVCIFPVLFVVVLAPAIFNAADSFSQM